MRCGAVPGVSVNETEQSAGGGAAGSQVRELILAGGCFWCLDAVYRRVRGVLEVVSGYTGGSVADPGYEAVCSGTTGHAEAVLVRYDAAVVPEEVLLQIFFTAHDPTSLNRQGHDVGTQYRSAMFHRDGHERARFAAAIERAQELYRRPIVTTLEPAGPFYPAEAVHQGFYDAQPSNGYCRVVIDPKIAKAREHYAMWLER
jgi:peptide-methionine (S)-S-oxide reductase